MIKLGIYKHYKGQLYQILSIARHSETLEHTVVYQALYGDYGYWLRPLRMFQENVVYDGKLTPRFSFIRDHLSVPPSIDQKQKNIP
jgi:hypothetical protein